MKYRRNKVKREHSIIKDALAWLEELTRHPEVTDIIPGVIEVSRSPERGIVYKYETQTGCKILLKSNGSIQEAFVVTKNSAFVKDWVQKRFPSPVAPVEEKKEPAQGDRKLDTAQTDHGKPEVPRRGKPVTESQTQGTHPSHTQKNRSPVPKHPRSAGKGHSKGTREKWTRETELETGGGWTSAGELDPANVGEQISPAMRRALRDLQRQLSVNKGKQGKGQKDKK
ncbi:MAG: DUF2103 domain-containing protein [Desulfitobacteriaceae bacterium]